MELVLSAPTTSWLALGWRPQASTKACQDFPSSLGGVLGKDFHPMDCTDMVVGFSCTCPVGYSGDTCQTGEYSSSRV